MGHLLGYARVSTVDQDPQLQLNALAAAGCDRIWTDYASGSLASRPQLDQAVDHLRAGDTLVVWKLDRLGRSIRHLIEMAAMLEARGVDLRSLTEGIDTTTPAGRLYFNVMAAVAEFERDLLRERTHAGLAAARAKGRRGGRPPVMTASKLARARALLNAGELTTEEVARAIGVGRTTLYRHLQADGHM